jgi:hypothetical protein
MRATDACLAIAGGGRGKAPATSTTDPSWHRRADPRVRRPAARVRRAAPRGRRAAARIFPHRDRRLGAQRRPFGGGIRSNPDRDRGVETVRAASQDADRPCLRVAQAQHDGRTHGMVADGTARIAGAARTPARARTRTSTGRHAHEHTRHAHEHPRHACAHAHARPHGAPDKRTSRRTGSRSSQVAS